MNPIVDIVFTLTWVLLLVWAIRSMAQGWSKPVRDYNHGTWPTQVKKPVHPEMVDVKPGQELMGVTFDEKPNSCDLEEYKDLQARIEVLRAELEDEDEDDDGDVLALNR